MSIKDRTNSNCKKQIEWKGFEWSIRNVKESIIKTNINILILKFYYTEVL